MPSTEHWMPNTEQTMAFNWLDNFYQEMEKPLDYAEKTLAQYRLGMRAKGSIVGVRIEVNGRCCPICSQLDTETVYHPDDAPHLPPPDCERGQGCLCVYRPVMAYEQQE
jgi:hypothetical protein